MNLLLEENVIEMYSKNNEGKFVIRTLKAKSYKYDFSIKNWSINKLDDIVVNKYNNVYIYIQYIYTYIHIYIYIYIYIMYSRK